MSKNQEYTALSLTHPGDAALADPICDKSQKGEKFRNPLMAWPPLISRKRAKIKSVFLLTMHTNFVYLHNAELDKTSML